MATQDEDKERKRAGAAPWGLAGTQASAESEGILATRSASLWGSRALPQWIAGSLGWVTSNTGIGIMTVIAVAGSVYGLYSLGMQSVKGPADNQRTALFDRQNVPSEGDAHASSASNSVDYVAAANRGALGDEAPGGAGNQGGPVDAAQTPAPPTNAQPQPATAPDQAKPDLATQRNAFLNRAMGAGNGLAGGSGMSGGLAQSFQPMQPRSEMSQPSTKNGKLLAMASGPTRASIGRAMGAGAGRGTARGAMGQLYNANRQSGAARNSSGESSAYRADQAFSGASAPGGSIGGAGLSAGGGGVSAGSADQGGPINNTGGASTQAPATGSGADVTPWTGMVMMAMSMLMVASAIILIMGLIPNLFGIGTAIKMLLFGIAAALAGIATALGVTIMTMYGQHQQGMILTTGGAITTAAAVAALVTKGSAKLAWLMVLGGIAGIAASIGSMLFSGGSMPGTEALAPSSSSATRSTGGDAVQQSVNRLENQ